MTEQGNTSIDTGTVRAGVCLGDRYTLTRLIGTGGMASVWLAHDPRLDRDVAIKIISDTLALDSTFVDRFEREARIAAALSHPHVVGAFDYGTHGGRPYLVMEYVPGGTLSARLKDGRIDWDPVVLADQLLEALSHIHAAGILHRDLKPANVLFGSDGRARLTDFGIANLADATKLTSTGFVVGTERYLAPEVRRGGPSTVASDLFGLGVLLRECTPTPVPPALADLIDRLTHPDPDGRPKSAERARAFLAGDTAALPLLESPADTPTVADVPTVAEAATVALVAPTAIAPAELTPPPPRRWTPRQGLGALLALLLVVAVVLTLANRDGGSKPLQAPPSGGSVTKLLDQLDSSIDHARR